MKEQELRNIIVTVARSWVGTVKGSTAHHDIIDTYNSISPLPRHVRMSYAMEWCAATASAAFQRCGLVDLIPAECSCGLMIQGAKEMGIWQELDDHVPELGDLCFYDWQDDGKGDNTGAADHVGIVTETHPSWFRVTEGNMVVDGVSQVGTRTMGQNGRYIRGFICPDFAGKAKLLSEGPGYLVPAEQQENEKEKEEAEMNVYKTLNDVPEWGEPTIRKLMKRGVIKGEKASETLEETEINVSYDLVRTLVILDRCGLFKEGV